MTNWVRDWWRGFTGAEQLPSPPKKKMRTITVDDKRRGEVISRHWRWRQIKDNPRHLEAIEKIGVTSEMGEMTVDYRSQEKANAPTQAS